MIFTRDRRAVGTAVIGVIVVIVVVAAVGIYFALGSPSPAASTTTSSSPSTSISSTTSTSTTTPPSTTTPRSSTSATTTSTTSSTTTTTTTTSSTSTTTSSTSTAQSFPFSLSNNPNTILISPGNNLTYASIGFILLPSAVTSGSEKVNLTVTVPTGLTLKLQNNVATITIGSPSQPFVGFSLVADKSLAPGKYTVNVVGTSGSVTQNLAFSVNVVQYLVVAQGNHFGPQSLTVPNGATVYWLNLDSPSQDPEVHNIVFATPNVHSPDIGPAPTYGTFSYTFTSAGSFSYQCVYHPGMTGTVTVTA